MEYSVGKNLKFYVDEEGKVTLSLHLRNLLDVKAGDEVNIFFDFEKNLICIQKVVPNCISCGTSEERIVEIFREMHFCKKCFQEFIGKNFEE